MTPRYPIGIETFEKMIEGGFIYADKTKAIYELTKAGQFFFLSRPRRFGKSLMLSTLEAYFQGRKELFEGLWLGSAEGVDWTPRAVLRLNFVMASPSEFELNSLISNHLTYWERRYGITHPAESFSQRFRNVIVKAHEVSGQKVVVLIDEYDKVLVNSLHDAERHERMKEILKPVFSVLKGADQHIEFGMLTGVSRFSKLSIFSDLNNLADITLDERFCTICGITEDEIRRFMRPGVEALAAKKGIDFEAAMQLLKDNYDGYHFSENCPDIYNPFSLLGALSQQKITHMWFESGTPTFLTKMMQRTDKDIRDILHTEADSVSLSSSDTMHTNLTALLFQTGYLTIQGYDDDAMEYKLGVPNREVSRGLFRYLLPMYSGKADDSSMDTVRLIRKSAKSGDVDTMLSTLQSFLAGIPYHLSGNKPEVYFENNLYIIFKVLGFYIHTEYHTARGRIDILMQTPDYIYIIELKIDGTPEEALRQIEEKGYAAPFATDPRRLIRIGINFSKQTRNIDRWIVE